MARIGSGTIVTGLTAAALAVIGVLAWQASAAPDHTGRAHPGAEASATHSSAPTVRAPAAPGVPADSGTGKRVVYALGAKRVWLVDADGRVERTFTVVPGTLAPTPGSYAVDSRTAQTQGSDGVLVEHVVRFSAVDGKAIGFSAAVDGSLPTPDPTMKTGGVREQTADGDAMWRFAPKDAKVVVVP
jgi:hypothetical protein